MFKIFSDRYRAQGDYNRNFPWSEQLSFYQMIILDKKFSPTVALNLKQIGNNYVKGIYKICLRQLKEP